jgi:WD40 repeat protein
MPPQPFDPFASGPGLFRAGACLLASALILLSARADESTELAELRASAALKKLEARVPGEMPKLRRDLLSFRLGHPGTKASLRAATLLAELPSPLDKLDASAIPALERFSWQPGELVGVLGEHRGRHGAAVAAVAFSPDGALVASGGGPYVRVWNPATMRLLGVGGQSHSTSCVAFTRDSKTLVSGTLHGNVYVWDLPKGRSPSLRYSVHASTGGVQGVACHPNNKIIACACFDNAVRLYDVSGPAIKEAGHVSGHTKAVHAVAYSPDGKLLASGGEDQTARLWDTAVNNYKEVSRIEGHTAGLRSLAFSTSGKTLATGCADGSIRLWGAPAAARPKAPRIVFVGPKGAVTSLSFSRSGQTLAATSSDHSVRLWNISTKAVRERFRLDGHAGVVACASYSPDMKLLVSGADDWTVRTWDLTKARPVERFIPWSHLSHVYSCAFSPDGQTVATGSQDRVVRFWDLARTEPRTRNYLKGDGVPVYAVAYSPDGKVVAAAGQSTRIRQWDAHTGATRPTLTGHAGYVHQMTWSPDGKYLLSASEKAGHLFDAGRGTEVRRFEKHQTRINCLGFSPEGKKVLTGSGAYLYDAMGKIVIKNNKYVYTDCVLRMWDAEKGEELATVKNAETPFYSSSFSAEGRQVFAGNYEATLRRWKLDGAKLTEAAPLKAAGGYCYGILPRPDGKQVITVGLDGRVVLWELASGKRVREWTFAETLGGLALSHDSRHLAVGLGTGVVYILRLGPPATKAKARVRP